MVAGGVNSNLFLNVLTDTDTGGLEGLNSLLSATEDKVTSVSQALARMQKMTSGFQTQTVPDIMGGKGSSIFAGQKGGPQQAGRALSPMNDALQEAQNMSLGANEGLRRYKETMDDAGNRVFQYTSSQQMLEKQQRKSNDAVNQMGGEFAGAFGRAMNLMFAGMALNMVLGRMRKSMMKMTGASQALGVAMKSTLLPIFLAINPLFISFSNAMIQLSRPAKMLIGVFFLLASALAMLMFVGGQAGLFWQSWGTWITNAASKTLAYAAGAVPQAIKNTQLWTAANTALNFSLRSTLLIIGSLVLALLLLGQIFKRFGPLVGTLAAGILTALLAVLSPIAAAAFALYAAFKAVSKIFKKFGDVIGTIAFMVIGVIGVLIAAFASLPIGIAIVIGALLALIWNMKDEIIESFKLIGQWLGDIPKWFKNKLRAAGNTVNRWKKKIVGFFEGLWGGAKKQLGNLIDFIKNLPSKISNTISDIGSAMAEVGKSIINGVVDGIESIGDKLADTFFDFLPGPLATAVKGVSKFSSGLVSRIQNVLTPNDFILTSGGKMIQPSGDDTIVGFNGKGPIQPGAGGSGNVEVNINNPVMKEDVDVQSVVDEVEERVNRNTRGRSNRSTL